MGNLSVFQRFEDAATSKFRDADSNGGLPSHVSPPAVSLIEKFAYQSYFDSTYLEKAILEQRANELIVRSTRKESDLSGYAIGLHPSSETPIAVQFNGVQGQQGGSSAIVIAPGQIIRPFGKSGGGAKFSGFSWGLPFGWLGGGAVNLYVFTAPDAEAAWVGSPEIVFHRARYAIIQPGSVAATASEKINWPIRFPWPNAYFQTTSVLQGGQPSLAITPTRTLLKIRKNQNAAPHDIRAYFRQADSFDLDSTGAAFGLDSTFADFTVPVATNPAGLVQVDTTNYPTVELTTGPLVRLGGDQARVTFVDVDAAYTGLYIDVIRYGKL